VTVDDCEMEMMWRRVYHDGEECSLIANSLVRRCTVDSIEPDQADRRDDRIVEAAAVRIRRGSSPAGAGTAAADLADQEGHCGRWLVLGCSYHRRSGQTQRQRRSFLAWCYWLHCWHLRPRQRHLQLTGKACMRSRERLRHAVADLAALERLRQDSSAILGCRGLVALNSCFPAVSVEAVAMIADHKHLPRLGIADSRHSPRCKRSDRSSHCTVLPVASVAMLPAHHPQEFQRPAVAVVEEQGFVDTSFDI